MNRNILLASHGTIGAREAEKAVINYCWDKTHITHLLVIPEFWKDMLGDDWLNNSCVQKRFMNYLENELEQETYVECTRIHHEFAKLGINHSQKVYFGQPQQCLLDVFSRSEFDLVITGSPRPREMNGLNSKMLSKKISRKLASKLITIPHPHGRG